MDFQLTQEILDKIDRFIKGELPENELAAFKKELEANQQLKEATILQMNLFDTTQNEALGIDPSSKNSNNQLLEKLKNLEYQGISNKIKQIAIDYEAAPPTKDKSLYIRFKKFIPAVAAILIIIVISTINLMNNDPSLDQYYFDNANWENELPSFAEKSDDKSLFALAESLFKAKEYSKSIQAFELIDQQNDLYPFSLLYIGASHANLNQDKQALDAFNRLAQMNEFAESSKGLWYSALIRLKQKDKNKAIDLLKKIVEDSSNYKQNEALEILKELE